MLLIGCPRESPIFFKRNYRKMIEDQQTPEEGTAEIVTNLPEPQETGVTPSPEVSQQSSTPAETSEPQADVTETSAAQAPDQPKESAPEVKPAAPANDEDLFDQYLANMGGDEPGSQKQTVSLSKGERIEARVILVEKDRVFVDLGMKAEGVIPLSELASENLDSAVGHVKVDDTFEVIVIQPSGSEGNPVVSKRRADFDAQWHKILDAYNAGEIFSANVIERVKGGLVVDIGVRGFVPTTHVGRGKFRNLEKFVGEVLPVKILEVDRERKKVVLSNREAETERKDEIKQELFESAKPGDVMEGVVRRITPYGAFIDLGGVDGLLHISEMSWARIEDPSEIMKEGDTVKVMILKLDEKGGRISLGHRQVLPDPWKLIRENYKRGEKVKLTVTRMVQNGAFLKLPEGAEAFLPLSEISDEIKLKKPQEALELGQEIEPTIIDVRADERRMILSLREGAASGNYRYEPMANMRSPRRRGGTPTRRPAEDTAQRMPSGGATIGERLGMLKGLVRGQESAKETEPESADSAKE